MKVRTNLRIKARGRRAERGYILLILLLFVAMLVIAAGAMAPIIAFQVKRDREEELIHRGVQYSRAMKYFVKKFGRYPTTFEELENTNQVRFLRRRYKDPITGKDFKILHMGDVQMAFGASVAGATPVNGMNPGAPGAVGGPGVINGAGNTLGQAGLASGLNPGGLGSGLTPVGMNAGGANQGGAVGGTNAAGAQNSTQGADQSNGEDAAANGSNPSGQNGNYAAAGPGPPGSFGAIGSGGTNGQGQVFGGGPMVGVASTSHDKSIRVFNKKEHYNEWQFIYDPSTDRGGLLTTPNQPGLAGTGTSNAVQTGAPGAPGMPGAPGGIGAPGQPGPGTPPTQPGMQTPQLPPDQEQ